MKKRYLAKANRMIKQQRYRDLSPDEFREKLVEEARQELHRCLYPERMKISKEDKRIKKEVAIDIQKLWGRDVIRKTSIEGSMSGEVTVRWMNEND